MFLTGTDLKHSYAFQAASPSIDQKMIQILIDEGADTEFNGNMFSFGHLCKGCSFSFKAKYNTSKGEDTTKVTFYTDLSVSSPIYSTTSSRFRNIGIDGYWRKAAASVVLLAVLLRSVLLESFRRFPVETLTF